MPGGTDQTLRPFLWRATNLYPDQEIVSRTHRGIERYTYSEYDTRPEPRGEQARDKRTHQ